VSELPRKPTCHTKAMRPRTTSFCGGDPQINDRRCATGLPARRFRCFPTTHHRRRGEGRPLYQFHAFCTDFTCRLLTTNSCRVSRTSSQRWLLRGTIFVTLLRFDQCAPMDSRETHRREPELDFSQRFRRQIAPLRGDDPDPVLALPEKRQSPGCRLERPRVQSCQGSSRHCGWWELNGNVVRGWQYFPLKLTHMREAARQARLRNRFKQVIDSPRLECADRVVVVSGHEYYVR
jgi:hypothetical protein